MRKDYSGGTEIPILLQLPPPQGVMVFGGGLPLTKDPSKPPAQGEIYPINSTILFDPTNRSPIAKRYYTVENQDGKTGLFLQRVGGTGMVQIAIETYYQHDNLDLEDKIVEFSAESAMMLGGFDPSVYNLPDGKLYLTLAEADAGSNEVRIYAFKCT